VKVPTESVGLEYRIGASRQLFWKIQSATRGGSRKCTLISSISEAQIACIIHDVNNRKWQSLQVAAGKYSGRLVWDFEGFFHERLA